MTNKDCTIVTIQPSPTTESATKESATKESTDKEKTTDPKNKAAFISKGLTITVMMVFIVGNLVQDEVY